MRAVTAVGPGQRAADTAAGISAAAAASTWLSNANEIATFIASLVAILAGLFAIAAHIRKFVNEGKRQP